MGTEDTPDNTLAELLPSTDSDRAATVFVHSLAPVAPKPSQERLVTELGELVESGVLADLDLLVWGDSICTESPLTEVGSGQRIIDAVGEFYALSAKSELSVAPFFSVSTVSTEYTAETFSRIVPPSRALAVYEGEELVAAFPCLLDGSKYTPEDAVSHLARLKTASSEPVPIDESA